MIIIIIIILIIIIITKVVRVAIIIMILIMITKSVIVAIIIIIMMIKMEETENRRKHNADITSRKSSKDSRFTFLCSFGKLLRIAVLTP